MYTSQSYLSDRSKSNWNSFDQGLNDQNGDSNDGDGGNRRSIDSIIDQYVSRLTKRNKNSAKSSTPNPSSSPSSEQNQMKPVRCILNIYLKTDFVNVFFFFHSDSRRK